MDLFAANFLCCMSSLNRRDPFLTQVPPAMKPCRPQKQKRAEAEESLPRCSNNTDYDAIIDDALDKVRTSSTPIGDDDDSDSTHSEFCESGDESDVEGMNVMKHVVYSYGSKRDSKASANTSGFDSSHGFADRQEAVGKPQAEGDDKKASRERLQKMIWKFPRGWFGDFNNVITARQRYFAITENDETSLCYWSSEEASNNEEPLVSIPIKSIRDVIHRTDEDRELRVKVMTYSSNTDLTLRFDTSEEAESWVDDLKQYIRFCK